MDGDKIARLWADALSSPEEHTAALADVLADNIVTVSPLGTTEGKDAVLATFGTSPIAALFAQGRWSDPTVDGNAVSMKCTFPAQAPVGGVDLRITVEGERITRVETTMLPGAPPAAVPVKITDAMAEAVNGALANGTPILVAYVDEDGRPQLSYRGTVQAFSDDQLAMWGRNPEGGIVQAIAGNPNIALFYRDPARRTSYQFHGRARVDDTPAVRDRVFDNSPEPERNFDPQRRGVAMVIDIDDVTGRDGTGQVRMERAASNT